MTKVEKVLEKYSTVELINKELKNVASKKTRLKQKRTNVPNYEEKLQELLAWEDALKEAKNTLQPKKKFVTHYTKEDVESLGYDEVRKALKTIQSKKCLVQFSDQTAYEEAVKIEEWLKERREELEPSERNLVNKQDLIGIVEVLETTDVSQDQILEMLKNLL